MVTMVTTFLHLLRDTRDNNCFSIYGTHRPACDTWESHTVHATFSARRGTVPKGTRCSGLRCANRANYRCARSQQYL